jgi:ParB family transcriptional regulator, chromosome partitioning protein
MPPRKKKVEAGTVGLTATESLSTTPPDEVSTLARSISADGGAVLSTYREPFAGQWVVFASLPIERVEPTPYQRELSKTHADRLAAVIPKVGLFLDPVIATRHDSVYWTPNGMHRLQALKQLGAKAIVALVVPDPRVAYRILALNTEKAHNLKDKALEVIRMARGLAATPDTQRRNESEWAFEFEEPAYLTLGLCYEENARFAGGGYQPVIKRCEEFMDAPIGKALEVRTKRRDLLLALDEAVNGVVAALKEAGLKSAYLKPFVIARINPLRFVKAPKPGQKAPRAEFEATIKKMLESAKKFDAKKVRPQDLAAMGGAPPAEE